jgi:transaldolase
MPPATIAAFRDHGQVRLTLEEDFEGARRELAELSQVGVDLRAATQKLEDDGVKSFSNDFAKLLGVVEEKRKHVLEVQRT